MRESRALEKKPVTDECSKNLPHCAIVIPDFGPAASTTDAHVPAIQESADVSADRREDLPEPRSDGLLTQTCWAHAPIGLRVNGGDVLDLG